ncbi:NAD(P)/FAD-dependent oxidoreductase [Tianweitania populi]|uniref:(2Fe-2S)-binding protein n=1 Tax=Tianweitania populi TaxID=1607949 RepID=A0A8J3DWM0_9HYPH|nr:NAD(P)/FAD-dependent oxidoreductase [Tianweitania populi]GHD13075.1 (2Fe-2S)-binding protein [Tianweitania populi]
MTFDPRSVAGKTLDIASRTEVLVVGAGPAGLAAAKQAIDGGATVMLVDENPVAFETMGESVPQLWGGLMGGQIRNRNAMTERMLEARPELADLFETGVDIRLGTACWGLFVNHANLNWMPGSIAGLADADGGSQLIGFDQAIVATGRRDMGLAFHGWDQPGVGGISAAATLATLYAALEGKAAVVLGTTPETLLSVIDLVKAGVTIKAIVEQGDHPFADATLVARIEALGIPILTGETVRGAGFDTNGIHGIRLRDTEIACDSILLGLGAVPVIDLLQAAGVRTIFDGSRGGFVPVLGDSGSTTLANVRAAGDCAGIWGTKSADERVSRREGRIAADAALGALGKDVGSDQEPTMATIPDAALDIGYYRKQWVRTVLETLRDDVPVCQCEDVWAREILEVHPPRYLNAAAWVEPKSLTQLLGEGPPNPDQVKRLTRAGMGHCQGRRCREQVQAMLALQENLELGAVSLAVYRSPVRPLSLQDLSPAHEDPAMAEQWDSWFGMPRQWTPYWEIEKRYTVASLARETDHVTE